MKTNAKVFPALLLDVKHEGGFLVLRNRGASNFLSRQKEHR